MCVGFQGLPWHLQRWWRWWSEALPATWVRAEAISLEPISEAYQFSPYLIVHHEHPFQLALLPLLLRRYEPLFLPACVLSFWKEVFFCLIEYGFILAVIYVTFFMPCNFVFMWSKNTWAFGSWGFFRLLTYDFRRIWFLCGWRYSRFFYVDKYFECMKISAWVSGVVNCFEELDFCIQKLDFHSCYFEA